jgi:tRNA(adenine34) deaminase
MCAMALMHARVGRIVFAAADLKTGAVGSVLNLFDNPKLNHHTQVQGGLLADAAGTMLRDFFVERRAAIKAARDASPNAELLPVPEVIESEFGAWG